MGNFWEDVLAFVAFMFAMGTIGFLLLYLLPAMAEG